jgi:hypothetical protein
MSTTDWVATVGVTLLLLAFVLNQRGVLAENSFAYLGLNFAGAGVAGAAAWMGGIIPFVVLEGVWAAVAGWGLLRLVRRGRVVGS